MHLALSYTVFIVNSKAAFGMRYSSTDLPQQGGQIDETWVFRQHLHIGSEHVLDSSVIPNIVAIPFQVTDWFTNWRARRWRPGMAEVAKKVVLGPSDSTKEVDSGIESK